MTENEYTNEQLIDFMYDVMDWRDVVDHPMIYAVIEELKEIQQYRAIGTIEEFKALKEKNEPKKILYRKQSYGTPWLCPYCEADQIKVEFFSEDGSEPKEKYTFCWQCGTRIDWSE